MMDNGFTSSPPLPWRRYPLSAAGCWGLRRRKKSKQNNQQFYLITDLDGKGKKVPMRTIDNNTSNYS